MKNISVIAAAILAFTSAASAEPLKVGFIGGFTGPGKAYGTASRNGFEMGRTPGKLEVIFEDDQFDSKQTITAFRKLDEVDKVDVIVSLGSSPAKAIAPLADDRKIPVIAWASDEGAGKGRRYLIRSWVDSKIEGAAIAEEAKRRAIQKPAFISVTGDYAEAVQRGFIESFGAERVPVTEQVTPDSQDFRALILKASSKVDGFGLCLNPGQSGVFAKQLRELGKEVPIFGCIALDDDDERKISGGALAGAWYVTGGVKDEFRDAYVQRFGSDDLVAGAAVHHDVAKLLESIPDSIRTREGIRDALLAYGDGDGAVGKFTIRVTDDDRYFDVPLVVRTVG